MRSIKPYLFVLIILMQASPVSGQECSCEQKFQFIKHEIETNYAGFSDKVNVETRKEYDKLTRETLTKVKKITNEGYCMYALNDWRRFFNDDHVQLFDPRQPDINDTLAINERIKKTEVIKLSPQRLKQLETTTDHEEGIYYYGDSSYKIAVIKSKNEFRDYVGVIIESKYAMWKAGQVKLELQKENDSLYKAILYMRDHSYRRQHYYFNGTSFDGGNWNKVGKSPVKYTPRPSRFQFQKVQPQKLSDSTLYIQIGTFNISNARAIDSVIKANSGLLSTMPNLVIDLRRNGGGGDEAFAPLIPYIYTDPIVCHGNDVFATTDNVKRYRQKANDPDYPDDLKAEFKELADQMEQNLGKFIVHAPTDTMKSDTVKVYPRKIVILTDKNCASSTEEFLLAARQSKKVTLMGDHTYGELDYSNWLVAESPCNGIEFHYSSTKSSRIRLGLGIDGKGILPDIKLSYDKDWIDEARKFLEK